MTHLTSDELIDAMEEVLAAERRAHLDACPECRRQMDGLAGVLREARQAETPEPSPLFWQHLSANINAEIDKQLAGAWPQWLRWQVLLPLGAVAMIILVLMASVPKNTERAGVVIGEPTAVAEPETDNWAAVANLVGEFDVDSAAEAGLIAPGVADEAVLQLTAEEQATLSRLLQEEMTRAKS